jgi:hypothetical protein
MKIPLSSSTHQHRIAHAALSYSTPIPYDDWAKHGDLMKRGIEAQRTLDPGPGQHIVNDLPTCLELGGSCERLGCCRRAGSNLPCAIIWHGRCSMLHGPILHAPRSADALLAHLRPAGGAMDDRRRIAGLDNSMIHPGLNPSAMGEPVT